MNYPVIVTFTLCNFQEFLRSNKINSQYSADFLWPLFTYGLRHLSDTYSREIVTSLHKSIPYLAQPSLIGSRPFCQLISNEPNTERLFLRPPKQQKDQQNALLVVLLDQRWSGWKISEWGGGEKKGVKENKKIKEIHLKFKTTEGIHGNNGKESE